MSQAPEYRANLASESEIATHLYACDLTFIPPLSERIRIEDYARKIAEGTQRFEAWVGGELVGLVAAYCNDGERKIAFITSVSVLPAWQERGIASGLLKHCINYVRRLGFVRIELNVSSASRVAAGLYKKYGFTANATSAQPARMYLTIRQEPKMKKKRDYNVEIKDVAQHRYAYNFDFDVMHPYMIRSFEPFFRKGNVLELGSFKGDFTMRLLSHFTDITCVEASGAAMKEARRRLGAKVVFVHSPFETAKLPKQYDNIVMTHVLEHLDDPVRVLKRVSEKWLAKSGRLFLVCPNANAPSRQIAVKMGLIAHNSAITSAEAEHGHRCTYSLDTLERDAVAAGLKVVHRTGIFFKALANFQWDRLLQTDIVSKDYLEGCYKLGQQYPDLCASIFLVCERGCTTEA